MASASRANGCGRGTSQGGRAGLLRALVGRAPRGARRASSRPRSSLEATMRYWRTWLKGARIPDHRWRCADRALGARRQGPHVHADRRDRRGAHDVAAGDAGRRTQLGLPLHVAARLHVHAAGAALPEPRLGGAGVHAVHRRPRAKRRRRAADHVRDRRAARPHRVAARGALGLRGRASRARGQRRLRPAPERRLRRRARLDPPAHAAAASDCRAGCGR